MVSATRLRLLEVLVFVDADAADTSASSSRFSTALVVAHALLLLLGGLVFTAVAFWNRGNVATEASQEQLLE